MTAAERKKPAVLPARATALLGPCAGRAGTRRSTLRRAFEALLDLGRHVLAKRFALAPAEYKQIASGLVESQVLDRSGLTPRAKTGLPTGGSGRYSAGERVRAL